MAQPDDTTYMRRCLELASRAEGCTSPNPMVGSVIVCNGKIIGEGFHLKAGTPHAEVHAINSVADKSLLPESSLYVNLEPCSHQGRTPPCADLIINTGIKRVIVGTKDTSLKVAGKGIEKMRQAGIEVVTGIEEQSCRDLNKRFFTWNEKKRPYVILKWARSADWFIDQNREPGSPVEPNWITGMAERVLVHKWRAAEDAILVGGGTVRADNPLLNVRLWTGKNPIRVIISRSGNIPSDANIFKTEGKVMIFTMNNDVRFQNAEVIILQENTKTIETVLNTLYNKNVLSLLVEGGSYIIKEFAESGLWDETRRFTGRKNFGEGLPDPFPGMNSETEIEYKTSTLDIGFNYSVKNKRVE